MLSWFFRCIPLWSTIIFLFITIQAFRDSMAFVQSSTDEAFLTQSTCFTQECLQSLTVAQLLYVIYTLIMQIQFMIWTPQITLALYQHARKVKAVRECRIAKNIASLHRKSEDFGNESDSDDSIAIELPDQTSIEDSILHAIIIPNYTEDLDTLRETLSVLARHPRAQQQYEIYLAMEEKEVGSPLKASRLISEYGDGKIFRNIRSTFHPANVPGELAGKSSNVAHAASVILEKYHASSDADNVIITVIDADTHLLQDYFSELRRFHCTYPETAEQTIYTCPIVFDRNSNESPVLVRCADIFWCWAGVSLEWHPLQIPISVYSIPYRLAESVDGWDTGPGAIGEDMHMLLKCFWSSNGRVRTRVIYSAASQCDISGSRKKGCFPIDINSHRARFAQATRHMWGSLDTGYSIMQWLRSPHLPNLKHFAIAHILWQTHFYPVHITISLVISSLYSAILGENFHPAFTLLSNMRSYVGIVSVIGINIGFYTFDMYHNACAEARAQDMAGIPSLISPRKKWHWSFIAERFVIPFAGILYGSIPAAIAEFCHLWTDRLAYVVSKKPSFSLPTIMRSS